jgi:hypothetical protein
MGLRGNPECHRVSVNMSGMELSEAVRGIRPRMHKGMHSYRLRSNMGKDVQRMGRDDIREVRDYSNAVPSIRSIVGRCVNGWGSVRKSRGRVRT